jgi:3-dehydroquinate synthase
MRGPFAEKLVFTKSFSVKELCVDSSESPVFFIDEKLKDKFNKKIVSDLPVQFLKGGEGLKTLEQYKKNINFLTEKKAHKKTTVVAIGGGSLLDSIGFLASTYLRGVDLILVPTTWLACVDASVGGKTALNLSSKKNQIGTVYPPKAIIFCEDLIYKPSFKEAQGEILKTIFLSHNSKWAKNYISSGKLNFKTLKDFVGYKTKIVKSDPDESKGLRTVLNLGHTLAHIIELKKNLSHGEAVLYGLSFSLNWSYNKNLINHKNYKKLFKLLPEKSLKELFLKEKHLKELFYSDKKRVGNKISFVFITDKGPEVIKISFDEFLIEYKRQLND